ncbi:MAG TPA: WD40 repeat domain-containing protein, partial [Armatimonadota bacterium]|nr:WD40 repeat domain-containing protein [Armatimonadota bacterium]
KLFIQDTRSWTTARTLLDFTEPVVYQGPGPAPVRWSPNGEQIATFSPYMGRFSVWEVKTGKLRTAEVKREDNHAGGWLAWSSDGRRLAYQDYQRVIVWELATGRKTVVPDSGNVVSGAWRPKGKWLALGQNDGAVRLWKLPPPKSPK